MNSLKLQQKHISARRK